VDLVDQGVKRVYRSRVRSEGAEETRARIRQAAAELFATRGYVGTTLKEVAERAGVGERTLYDNFGGKLELLRHTISMLTMGDESRVRAADRPEAVTTRALEDPHEALALHVRLSTDLMDRAGDLILMGTAVPGADPGLARAVERGTQAAYELNLQLAQRFAERGELRPGLDVETAADILFTLCSPGVFSTLRRIRRWPQSQYYRWVLDCAEQQLLGRLGSQA
jgi:AcrR family transcriptional regulator